MAGDNGCYLYHGGASTCSAKVRFALAEKGVQWNGQLMDVRGGETHESEYLKVNPKGLVPVLVHRGNVIAESSIINEYIDDAFDSTSLIPCNAEDKAAMRMLIRRVDDELHSAVGMLSFATFVGDFYKGVGRAKYQQYINTMPDKSIKNTVMNMMDEGVGGDLFEKCIHRSVKLLSDFNGVLAGRKWFLGGDFSLADIAISPYINRLEMLQILPSIVGDEMPDLMRWFNRVRGRDHFSGAVSAWISETECQLMAEGGSMVAGRVNRILGSN